MGTQQCNEDEKGRGIDSDWCFGTLLPFSNISIACDRGPHRYSYAVWSLSFKYKYRFLNHKERIRKVLIVEAFCVCCVWHSLTCVTNQIWRTWGSALSQVSHTALCRSGGTYLSREVVRIPPRQEGHFCAVVIVIRPRAAILWCWSIPQLQFTLICFTPTCESQSAALKVQGNWELSNQRKKNLP